MFKALMKRRAIRFKHDCYAAAIVASAVANTMRTGEDDHVFTPWDWVQDATGQRAKAREIENIRKMLHAGFSQRKFATAEHFKKAKEQAIENLNEQGYDGAAIFRSVFAEE